MSEQPADQPKLGEAWGDAISEERQAYLQGYLDRWTKETDHGTRKGPFDRSDAVVTTHLTGADVYWPAKRVPLNSDEPVITAANLHLEGAYLERAHLEKADLRQVHLETLYVNTPVVRRVEHITYVSDRGRQGRGPRVVATDA